MKNFMLAWSSQQDQFLKSFCFNKQNIDWKQVSSKFYQNKQLRQKSALQCQQRFQQICGYLQSTVEWNQVEQRMLIQKHCQIGNKWASISQFLNGKSDNCVKNHFYSKLRKMIRMLNRIIQTLFKKQLKVIANQTVYKLVEASEQRFKDSPICTKQISLMAQSVIQSIFIVSLKQDIGQKIAELPPQNIQQYKQLIERINEANKNYKKKSKKLKNSTIKAPIRKSKNKIIQYKVASQDLQGDDQYSSPQIQQQQHCQAQFKTVKSNEKITQKNMIIKGPTQNSQDLRIYQPNPSQIASKVQVKTGNEMQLLLLDAGLLQSQQTNQFGNSFLCKSGWSIKSHSQCDNSESQNHFFDDSNPKESSKKFTFFSKYNPSLMGDSHSQMEQF